MDHGAVTSTDGAAPTDSQGIDASVPGLAVFDGGDVESEVLGFVHPHGRWLDRRVSAP